MKDDNKGLFNAPDPIFTQSPDEFEDIAAPLTAGTRITFASSFSTNSTGIVAVNNEIHSLQTVPPDHTSMEIRRYSLTGTDLGSPISLSNPTSGPSSRSGATFWYLARISFDNNKYHIGSQWYTGNTRYWSISTYSSSGVFESTASWTISGTITGDMDVRNNILIYSASFGFRALNLTTGSQLGCTSGLSTSNSGIAFNEDGSRIYANNNRSIRAYTNTYNRATRDDTNTIRSFDFLTVGGSTLFGLQTFTRDIYPFTGVRVPAAPSITASWASPSYLPFSRSIVATVSFTGNPRMFDADDFEVQEQNAQGSWVDASTGTWTTTSTGTGTSRVVTATPNSSVAAGTYRINLPVNAFEMNQPSAAAATTGQAVAAYVAPSYTWSTAAITPAADRSVSVTMTFSVDPGTLDAEDDFEVQHRTSTGPDVWTDAPDANWALTISGTGTSRIVRAAPVPMVAAGTYRLRLKADALEADHPPDAVASPAFAIATYVEPPGVATAAWSGQQYCLTSNRLSATITFSGEKVEGLATEDFEIVTSSGGTTIGWAIVLPGTISSSTEIAAGTGTLIEAIPPANQNASFRIRLKQLSVMSDDSSTDNAPADNVDSDPVGVDNRSIVIIPTVATARWSSVVGGQTLSGALVIGGTAITGLEVGDFKVFDSADADVTGTWTITLPASFDGTLAIRGSVTVLATPPANTNGTFYLRLDATSVISDGSQADNAPVSNVDTVELAVNNTVTEDGRSEYTLQFVIPDQYTGAIQISIPANSFNVSGQDTQIGPRSQQYLGTVQANYEIVPRVVLFDPPERLEVGDNNILLDFNTPVKGISTDAFILEGMSEIMTIPNDKIFYASTGNPYPNVAARTTPIIPGTTSAQYYKLVITVTGTVPTGILSVYLKDNVVNND